MRKVVRLLNTCQPHETVILFGVTKQVRIVMLHGNHMTYRVQQLKPLPGHINGEWKDLSSHTGDTPGASLRPAVEAFHAAQKLIIETYAAKTAGPKLFVPT